MFGTAAIGAVFSDENGLKAWIQTEIALAKSQEKLGIIPSCIAAKIEPVGQIENLDLAEMKADFDRVGFPILPFVKQLNKAYNAEIAR